MYYRYCPDLLAEWDNQNYSGVVENLAEKPYHYLPFICCDFFQRPNYVKDLIRLAAEFATLEDSDVDELAEATEDLLNEWNTGSMNNQLPYDSVAGKLLLRPRCEVITFCAALLEKEVRNQIGEDLSKQWNVFHLGMLAGAFCKNEKELNE